MTTIKKQIGTMSLLDFFCIGFGCIVGVGWAVTINRWMANTGGALPAATGYLFALLIMIPIGLTYAELVPMMPVAGGSSAFAYKAFGEKIAFISGWACFGGFVWILPWESIMVAEIISMLAPGILFEGGVLYEFRGWSVHISHLLLGTACTVFLFLLNLRGGTASTRFQRIFVIFMICAGIITIIAAFFKFDVQNLMPVYENIRGRQHNNFFTGMLTILLLAPFFLAGFETIPQMVEQSKVDPKKVGKIVILSIISACLFYAILLIAVGGAMPWIDFWGDGQFGTPAAGLLLRHVYSDTPALGNIFYITLTIGALTGLITTWNGFMRASSYLLMGMGRARMVPAIFAKTHPKYGTPYMGLIFCSVISFIGPFLGFNMIDGITELAGAAFVTTWCITAFCVVKLRKIMPDSEAAPRFIRPYKMPGGSILAGAAGTVLLIALVFMFLPFSWNPLFMDWLTISYCIGWAAIGAVFYFMASSQRKALTPQQRSQHIFEPK
jgi:amino acid transporter